MTPCRLAMITLAIFATACGGGKKNEGDTEEEDAAPDSVDSTDVPTDTPTPCETDEDCSNDHYCDGEETCGTDGTCDPGTAVDCDDLDPCTMDTCDDDLEDCVSEPLDGDGDGFIAMEAPTGEACGGTDCDDTALDVYPGADDDECDLVDKDCDTDSSEHIDDDADGWIDEVCDGLMTDHTGYEGFGDCDDTALDVYPDAPEGCDGTIDHDCDGDSTEIDTDADGDTFPPPSCGGTDCDDSDPLIYPGATTRCDLVDDDCTGFWWDDADADDDGDHYLDEECGGDDCDDTNDLISPAGTVDCTTIDHDCNGNPDNDQDGDGSVRLDAVTVGGSTWPACGGTDCDDANPAFHPGASLTCNTVDHDCNGLPDEDNDGDGHVRATCTGGDDCDDANASVYPGAPISCDLVDHDCNSNPDQDNDGDGHVRETCSGGDDCNDTDGTIYPGAAIDCSTTDHDCNDNPDQDNDNDGYVRSTCSGGDDCNDTDSATHPGAAVTCTSTDRDCNGNPDNDQDGDGHIRGNPVSGWPSCSGDDCNDTSPTVYTGATEICDDIDQDCDGLILDAPGADDDLDTYLDDSCPGGTDCDDTWDRYHPVDPPSDVCTADDYDCDTILDALGAPDAHLIQGATVYELEIAWSGSEYGVLWRKTNGVGRDILFARLDGNGVVITGSEVWITADTIDKGVPDIEWGSDRWGIVWYDANGIFVKTLASNGTDPQPATGGTSLAGAGCESPAIAYDGMDFGVVWECGTTLRFVPVDRYTAVPPVAAIDLQDVAATDHSNPDIAWAPDRYGVVWRVMEPSSNREIYMDIVDPVTMTDIVETKISNAGTNRAAIPKLSGGTVDVGGSGPGFGIVWIHNIGTNSIFGAVYRLGAGASSPVALAPSTRLEPKIEWNGTSFGIVFTKSGTPFAIEFMQMSPGGAAAGPIVVINPSIGLDEGSPTLAWENGRFASVFRRLSSSDSYFTYLWCTY